MAPPQATLHQGPPKNTMSATTSPAQLNQPAETAAPETRSLSKAAHTAYRIYKWLCLKARIKPVMSLRRKRGKGKDQRVAEAGAEAEDEDEDEDDIWTPEVYVYLLVGGHEVRATVNVIFDTGSLENIISTSCLREGFHGFAYSRSVGERIGTSLTGCEELLSIATIDIRWRGRNNRAQRPSIGPNYRYRVETSTCHVVESDEFDLIIGRPTINRLKLFTRNTDIFGGFRGVNKVKAENVEQEQKTADAQRDRAKEIKRLREKQEKEKKEAMKSTQQC